MAIEFNCPHCNLPYRNLKDELAGKRATCKNPDCRKQFVIPQPNRVTVPQDGNGQAPARPGARPGDDTPPPTPPADVEAAALSALSDAPAAEEKPVADRVIQVTCKHCDHPWTVPFAMAGKNVLCPECRRPNKVPEPKDEAPEDWRQKKTKLPSLAKENYEKPKDVVDVASATVVTQGAMKAAGIEREEVEPRPLKQKIFLVAAPLLLLAGLVYGVVYWFQSSGEVKEQRLIEDAIKEYTASPEKPPGVEASLYSGLLEMAAGEYSLRVAVQRNESKDAKKGLEYLTRARDEIRQAGQKDDARKPAGLDRYALACELALLTLELGGDEQQVREQIRYAWMPNLPGTRAVRPNEKIISVHGELQKTLLQIQPADFDLKATLARRLTRELVRRGQPGLATELPVLLFTEPEQPEAKAIVALEIHRLDKGSDRPRHTADELKAQLAAPGTRNPAPASAATLWHLVIPGEKFPNIAPVPVGNPTEPSRFAFAGLWTLQDKTDDALKLARRPGSPQGQLRALALIAEWSADPGPALGEAAGLVTASAKKTDVTLPPFVLLRLSYLAAAAGKPDHAKTFADAIGDDGLKAWAKADAVRARLTPENKEPADETAAEAPADAARLRVGHAWGRLWVARHNARLSGDQTKEVRVVNQWPPGTIKPFGLAGVALGLQDGSR